MENKLSLFIEKNYINNKNIFIGSDDWIRLNTLYSKEDIISALAILIVDKKIQIPLKSISFNEVTEKQKELTQLKTTIKKGDVFSRYEKNIGNLFFNEKSDYNIVSNYFHQEDRYKTDSINSPSAFRIWDNIKFAKSMLGALYSLKFKEVSMNNLHSCLAMRKYIASQFKPSNAKAIYDYFQPTNVVDFCAGWGDRLAGFYASSYPKTYFGIDANKNLQDNYYNQIKAYSSITSNKIAMIDYNASEDFYIFPTSDFIFTSPPYFGIEKYSKNDKQSFIRYKKFDQWLTNFLFKSINISYKSLKKNGILALNISDVYMNHKVNNICSPMINYAKEIGFKHIDTMGIKMAKRINSSSFKNGVFLRAIICFSKIKIKNIV